MNRSVWTVVAVALSVALGGWGRQASAQQAPAPGSPRAVSPIDLTGNWVSVVTEDWRFRMVTPPKGDYASVPLNGAARQVADAWDPAKDEAAGNACKAYGAAGIMRVPGRLRISWQDDTTLKIETDAGTQTRLLQFRPAQTPAGEAGWQGHSVATWEMAGGGFGGGFGPPGGAAPAAGRGADAGRGAAPAPPAGAPAAGAAGRGGRGGPPPRGGSLKVVTTHMKAGYLRKNGVPYSENTVLTEYVDRHTEANGDEWFTVTTVVEDSKYLGQPFITSTHFKKEADASKWNPTACKAS